MGFWLRLMGFDFSVVVLDCIYWFSLGEVFTFGCHESCMCCLDLFDWGIFWIVGVLVFEHGTWWVFN